MTETEAIAEARRMLASPLMVFDRHATRAIIAGLLAAIDAPAQMALWTARDGRRQQWFEAGLTEGRVDFSLVVSLDRYYWSRRAGLLPPDRRPSFMHATIDEAEAEAERLAVSHPGDDFAILTTQKFCTAMHLETPRGTCLVPTYCDSPL